MSHKLIAYVQYDPLSGLRSHELVFPETYNSPEKALERAVSYLQYRPGDILTMVPESPQIVGYRIYRIIFRDNLPDLMLESWTDYKTMDLAILKAGEWQEHFEDEKEAFLMIVEIYDEN